MKIQKGPVTLPTTRQIPQEAQELLLSLLNRVPQERIDWESFLNHPLIARSWERIKIRNVEESLRLQLAASTDEIHRQAERNQELELELMIRDRKILELEAMLENANSKLKDSKAKGALKTAMSFGFKKKKAKGPSTEEESSVSASRKDDMDVDD